MVSTPRPAVVPGLKALAWCLALAPAVWLAWGAWRAFGGDATVLGPDPAETIVQGSGVMGLRSLLATLLLGTLRDLAGLGWLVRLRRLLGLFAFFWACVHLAAYLWLELEGDVGSLADDLLERPYVLAGAVALACMVPLALTSTGGWQRRLGRRWKRLHRLVWPAAIAACVHLLWQARADLGEAIVYLSVFAAVAMQRLWTGRRRRAGARPRGPGEGPEPARTT